MNCHPKTADALTDEPAIERPADVQSRFRTTPKTTAGIVNSQTQVAGGS